MEAIRDVVRRHWGYEELLANQAEAIRAVIDGRDSVVVLPTGGGKSLCFQAPALRLPGVSVVVSPLISLMKDQVDALKACGVPAAFANSTSTPDEVRQTAAAIRSGALKLLYMSPERLMTEKTIAFLRSVNVSFFAIDEAHCISEWGHDFRPAYRQLATLKETFPTLGVHAYTATATAQVRKDIVRELRLTKPELVIGSFDRPNLIYRVRPRFDRLQQVQQVLDRHRGDSGLIYCIRRADVENLAEDLKTLGYSALPYHAGLSEEERRRNQEDFINDRAKIIVATVAFGMGIDKSNVRYVIHAAAPKSLESYQQESGRAGRDGLEAECWLFHGSEDFETWRWLQRELEPEALNVAMTLLGGIEDYCHGAGCRHAAIVRYFGQKLESTDCGACDDCLGEIDLIDDALVVGQKILSCVARLKENFGVAYTARVLAGSSDKRILENGHNLLSTYGILSNEPRRSVKAWIDQLIGQGFLEKSGEYEVIKLTPPGWEVLRGERTPRLFRMTGGKSAAAQAETAAWEGVDRALFESLRELRAAIATERRVPPYVIFTDNTLRELARHRPSSRERLRGVHGIGQKKCDDFGDRFLSLIAEYCARTGSARDVGGAQKVAASEASNRRRPAAAPKQLALAMFAEGKGIEEVKTATGRAFSTTVQYLLEHIELYAVCDPTPWVEPEVFEQVRAAADDAGWERLRPLFDALGGTVDYERIRIAVACLRNAARAEGADALSGAPLIEHS